MIITSNYRPVATLGAGVPVNVFTEAEALTFLAARTGLADAAGAARWQRSWVSCRWRWRRRRR